MPQYDQNSKPSDVASSEFEPQKGTYVDGVATAARTENEIDHDVYVAALIHGFNPPEDDVSQVSILLDAIDFAWQFIVDQPCTCPPLGITTRAVFVTGDREVPVTEYFGLQCRGCRVLGRSNDRRIER